MIEDSAIFAVRRGFQADGSPLVCGMVDRRQHASGERGNTH
jgi:hypothetical protein